MDLRPPPLDVSALICDCAVPGLKVDPTDSVLSPVSLTPPGPRPAAPVFSFPHLKPCPSCVPKLRMQPQGLYDFPPVDLPIHLAANCHHAVAAAQQHHQQEQQQTHQKGSSRSRAAQGSRLFSRRMMAEISGATPVDCAVASVVAAVTEASESVRRVRVALRVPGASVLYAAPSPSCAAAAAASGDGAAGGEGGLLSECCIHYTVDGSDPVSCEDQHTVGKALATQGQHQQQNVQQQQLQQQQQQQQTAPVSELSAQTTNGTNCGNNSTASGGSMNGVGSCRNNSDGANSSSNKNTTSSSSGSCGSPGFSAKAEQRESLRTKENPSPVTPALTPQQKL
ncbi:ubiquitin carboxyl-terminal hydrolase, putative [Eimeria mitis]|uniref:Ubiquitin carboxyl-terminal hydrolase, putative n=1 Tax=Eimeria mitis TaxID=44415 RepID=U6K712_9EIME|nr:ubiquitin carboxyl-terminal hydrolase, putative [Eimeria mitis]CDJ31263.1 ubiquitin carboxyl-terminal hydrolase, putative [Eimeria mitis]